MATAEALMRTCYETSRQTPTRLAPDCVDFHNPEGPEDWKVGEGMGDRFYFLRPEISESLYVLHHLTGNSTYRDWAWELFQGIEKYAKVGVAYGVYPDVRERDMEAEDCMESFFLAETLKYLYLIQDEPADNPRILESYVFNTEGHPIPIRSTVM